MRGAVIQIEMFLVQVHADQTLEGLMAECDARAEDEVEFQLASRQTLGAIKTAARFVDGAGDLALKVSGAQFLSLIHRGAEEAFFAETDPKKRIRIERATMRLLRAASARYAAVQLSAIEKLRAVIRAGGAVAVEDGRHAFRLLRDNERHELLMLTDPKRAVAQRKAMIFAFKPVDLCSDTADRIAYLM